MSSLKLIHKFFGVGIFYNRLFGICRNKIGIFCDLICRNIYKRTCIARKQPAGKFVSVKLRNISRCACIIAFCYLLRINEVIICVETDGIGCNFGFLFKQSVELCFGSYLIVCRNDRTVFAKRPAVKYISRLLRIIGCRHCGAVFYLFKSPEQRLSVIEIHIIGLFCKDCFVINAFKHCGNLRIDCFCRSDDSPACKVH